ncbi:SRPBCC family protein [Stella sp.]|uniref:aromatic ring-hydroxylating oxygenase subunit alpha n=1 Tax=Stella sp. TaxID=2912054 RepID=UPI0035B019DD
MDGDRSIQPQLAATRSELLRARHVPGAIYASPEIYRREMVEYFGREWLFVGREEQFAAPGDYEARRIAERPIVIARDKRGELNAFYNMCAHRGVEVAEGRGNARMFKCPYHGWTYDLTGQLTGAAYMRESEGFDPAGCRLPPIALRTWRGNVFVSFHPEPRDFAAAMAEFEADFAILHTERCRVADLTRIRLACNWKFFHENLMDFYHVGVLHAKSFGARFGWTPENVALKPGGGITIRYDAAPSTPDGQTRFAKAPWLEDRPNSFACTGFLPPNLTLFGRVDCVKLMTAWPLGPDACEVLIYLLFPEEFFADPEFEAKVEVYRAYQKVIYEEDRSMIESMQLAMASPVYAPGRMSIMEKPIHHFLNAYLDRMFGPGA